MFRKAVLDLGTNTFHLLIAEVDGSRIKPVLQKTSAVKLGEGGINKGLIVESAFQRGVKAIRDFARVIEQYEVTEIRAVGTAALRTAANGMRLIETIRRETGITIQVIDGTLEAELIYEGVRNAVGLDRNPVLIMDIGGGSVEFIIGNASSILWKKSYAIGAAKLMELFHKSDPIRDENIDQIEQHLTRTLPELKLMAESYRPELLIGSAGAFETYAALAVSFFNLPTSLLQKTELNFDYPQYQHVARWIMQSTHTERKAKPEIIPVRTDMIVVATVLTNYVLQQLNINRVKLSTYALKEGLLFRK